MTKWTEDGREMSDEPPTVPPSVGDLCNVCDCSHAGGRCVCLGFFDHPRVDDDTVVEPGGQLHAALIRGLRTPKP